MVDDWHQAMDRRLGPWLRQGWQAGRGDQHREMGPEVAGWWGSSGALFQILDGLDIANRSSTV